MDTDERPLGLREEIGDDDIVITPSASPAMDGNGAITGTGQGGGGEHIRFGGPSARISDDADSSASEESSVDVLNGFVTPGQPDDDSLSLL
ncbi:MAG: hypothetical protein HGB34_04415 [Candidatus Moranbacteria bacterium]|nr:hypothetical protein [Candidatus Moranbacteria bacterium]